MFGEDIMVGQSIANVDCKGRFTIPKWTGVETKDDVILLNADDHMEITSFENVKEKIMFCEEEIKKAVSEGNNSKIKRIVKVEQGLFLSILARDFADGHGRVNFRGNLKPNTAYKVVGANKSLYIFEQKNDKNQKER